MTFMGYAMGAITIAVILVIGYLVIAQAKVLMPSAEVLNDSNFTSNMASTQAIILSGFGLLAVGILVIAAWSIIKVMK